MFTLLWKMEGGGEEIYSVPTTIVIVPDAGKRSDDLDCRGRRHLGFQRIEAVSDDSAALHLARSVIDSGEVFVMNGEGKTVAMYYFQPEARDIIGHPG